MLDSNKAAEAAVELKLFQADLGEVALVVMIASMVRQTKAFNLEVLAHRCGLSEAVAESVIYDANRGAHLLGEAHLLLKQIAELDLADDLRSLIDRRMAARRRALRHADGVST